MNINPQPQSHNKRMNWKILVFLNALVIVSVIALLLWIKPNDKFCEKEDYAIQYPVCKDLCAEFRSLISPESQLEFIKDLQSNTSVTFEDKEINTASIEELGNCSHFLILASKSVHKYSTISNTLSLYTSMFFNDPISFVETYIMSDNKNRLVIFINTRTMGTLYHCDTNDLNKCKKYHDFSYLESIKMYKFNELFLVLVSGKYLSLHSFNNPTMVRDISNTKGEIEEIIISNSMEIFLLKDSSGLKIYAKEKGDQVKKILNYKNYEEFKNDGKNLEYFEALYLNRE